jgi:hypothetical protein
MLFGCGAATVGVGSVVFWVLSAADGAARRAERLQRQRRLMDGL